MLFSKNNSSGMVPEMEEPDTASTVPASPAFSTEDEVLIEMLYGLRNSIVHFSEAPRVIEILPYIGITPELLDAIKSVQFQNFSWFVRIRIRWNRIEEYHAMVILQKLYRPDSNMQDENFMSNQRLLTCGQTSPENEMKVFNSISGICSIKDIRFRREKLRVIYKDPIYYRMELLYLVVTLLIRRSYIFKRDSEEISSMFKEFLETFEASWYFNAMSGVGGISFDQVINQFESELSKSYRMSLREGEW